MAMKKICVAGDVTLDWFHHKDPSGNEEAPKQALPALHSQSRPGGASLMAEFLKLSLEVFKTPFTLDQPQFPEDIRQIVSGEIIHTNAMMSSFKGENGIKYRIEKHLGYSWPENGPTLSFQNDFPRADLVVVDDTGLGFSHTRKSWPKAVKSLKSIVYKMDQSSVDSLLWQEIKKQNSEELLVIVEADALRHIPGVQISKGLSWERTATDLVHQLQTSAELKELENCPFLIILFGTDGALIYQGGKKKHRATLIFDPADLEGGFQRQIPGSVIGLTALFTASVAGHLATYGFGGLEPGVKTGLARMGCFLETGYLRNHQGFEYPKEEIFSESISVDRFGSCDVPLAKELHHADPNFWRILDQKTKNTRLLVADSLVRKGSAGGLISVPSINFGNLNSIDRREIEQLSAVRQLIEEFLDNPRPPRPLCFAVFGPPGSGKSFSVKQIVKSLGRQDLAAVTFNISQFENYQDLVAGLHKVRDMVLSGLVPFVFFDEFDSAFGKPLGWLKYFLAPMQDGEFKDGEAIHPVGKAIFVFAGGTKSNFSDFVNNVSGSSEEAQDRNAVEKQFREAKGPDFVSRLRGFIDIMGPNRQDKPGEDDDVFVIRRAKLLRIMLQLEPTAKKLFDPQGKLNIDQGILRAFLHISSYKHGARSLSAIIEMSRLAGKSRFDLSSLPAKEQLGLHVDTEEFLFLASRERFQSLFRKADFYQDIGTIGCKENETNFIKAIEKSLLKTYKKHVANKSWPVSLEAVKAWPQNLSLIDCGVRKFTKNPSTPEITDREVEQLAQYEHDRWCREHKLQGWRPGRQNKQRKRSPYLLTYDDLTEERKKYYRMMIYCFPIALQDLGYETYRMKETEEFHNGYMIDQLARALHADYVQKRKKEGDREENNPAMVPWDKLHEDLQQANIDSAETIPKKLKIIGYNLKPIAKGDNPPLRKLDKEQIERIAEWEHTRWNWQKRLQGWVYKKGKKNEKNKTTPHLLPWDQLPDKIKEWDREPARLIPKLIKKAGYEVVTSNH